MLAAHTETHKLLQQQQQQQLLLLLQQVLQHTVLDSIIVQRLRRIFTNETKLLRITCLLLTQKHRSKVKGQQQLLMELHLTAMECHLPYGSHSVTFHPTQAITPRINPARQHGTRLTYPRRMEG